MFGTRRTRASGTCRGRGWPGRHGPRRYQRAPRPRRPVARPRLDVIALDPPEGDPTHPADPPAAARPHESALTPGDSARYDVRFASRASGIVSSVMRDLMSLSERPEIISLAGGFPNTESFEREIFDEVDRGRWRATTSRRPSSTAPPRASRSCASGSSRSWRHEGARAGVDDIMVTSGGQQAIDLSIRTFVNPGDTILAEGPTYPGAVPCFTTYEARVEHDPDGRRRPAHRPGRGGPDAARRRGPAAEAALHDPQLPQPRPA